MSQQEPTQQEAEPPLGESPWFWTLLFSLVGTLALGMMHHRYAARQQAIERRFYAREHFARQALEGRVAAEDLPARVAPDAGLAIPLWPMAVLFAMLAVTSAGMLYREWRRRESARPPHANP